MCQSSAGLTIPAEKHLARLKLTECTVDLVQGTVDVGGETVRLTTKELELLNYLVERSGTVVPRESLLEEVWGYAITSMTRAIDKTVARLRAKIRDHGRQPVHLHTVHGTGYRFELLVEESATARKSNVEASPTRFIGRASDMATIGTALEETDLVSLVGPAGVGKTRLATEIAATFIERGDEAWFVSLLDGPDVADRLADAIGVPPGTDPEPLGQAVASRGRCLVIADSAEGQLAALKVVLAALRPRAPEARWLVTSRTALRLPGERLIEVGPLDNADAIALFTDRARDRRADFAFEDDAEALALMRRLDGLPLAIELAAARVRVLTPKLLLERLNRRFEILTSARQGRHATLRGAIDTSWELLSEDDQLALARCSIFRGGFTLDGAEAVLGPAALDRIESLRNHSLLYTDESLRFFLYGSIRDYAAEHLPADDPARERHAAYFVGFGEQLSGLAHTSDGAVSIKRLRREVDNLMAVGPDREDSARAALAAFEALRSTRPRVALEWLTRSRGVGGELDDRIRIARAEILHASGANDEALAALAPVLAAVGPQLANALRTQGGIHHARREPEQALACYDQGIAIARAQNNSLLEGMFLSRMGALHHTSGRPDLAHEIYTEALAVHQRLGNRAQEARLLANLGILWVAHGGGQTGTGHAQAEAWFEGALSWATEIGDRVLEGRQLLNLAGLYADWDRYEEAEATGGKAVELLTSLGQRRSLGLARGTLGRLFHFLGRYPEADASYREALTCARDVGDGVLEGLISAHLGALCADRGQREVAEDHIERAASLLEGREPKTLFATTEIARGNLELARGGDPTARLERSELETRSVDVRWALRLLRRSLEAR